MRELQLVRARHLEWRERPDPVLRGPRDAIVRPFVAGRCDGDTLPVHRHVSRAMQLGVRTGLIDPVVASICGDVPFQGPFGIGHECIAEVIEIGAAGLAVAHGAEVVDYVDHRTERLAIAEKLGARAHPVKKGKLRRADLPSRRYDIVVEGTSTAAGVDAGLRALQPGGICTPVGYYLSPGTKVPLMHMYANDATLKIGVSHVRPILPDLLEFVAHTNFPAENVTTLLADWDDAPDAYRAHTTKLVLHRQPLGID